MSLDEKQDVQLRISKRDNKRFEGIMIKLGTAKKIHTDSELALQNGGWNYRRLVGNVTTNAGVGDKDKNCVDGKGKQGEVCRDVLTTRREVCRDVVIIRKEVPEFGTYRVEVTITANEGDLNNLTLFAGRRNMIERGILISKGKTYKKTFYQAVTPYIPALSSKRNDDKCIFVSIAGLMDADAIEDMVSVGVTREDVPVIWIAGDSTLTDQNAGIPYYPYGSCAGWAQTLARYVEKAAVCNLAHSGMTTNCFRDDGHYAIFQEFAKPGDFFILQFGHNDQKRRNLAAFGGYADNLRRYIDEVRHMGVEPIICSPISRIPLELTEDEAKELSMARHYSLLQEYADAAESVAKEFKVPFVDLHEMTFRKWIELGEGARDYFMPGDITHTNEYGAVLIADYFADASREFNMGGMFGLTPDTMKCSGDNFVPTSDTKALPAEYPPPSPFEIEPPYLDLQDVTEAEKEGIRKAFKYGLLDPCVMFIHPHDPMPRGQLLMVMFNAFRMNGTRPYKKKYPDIKVEEWISGYVQTMIEEGYLSESETSFRPDDPLTFGELSAFLMTRYEAIMAKQAKSETVGALRGIKKSIASGILACKESDADIAMTRAEVYAALADFMDKAKELSGAISEQLPENAEVHPVH